MKRTSRLALSSSRGCFTSQRPSIFTRTLSFTSYSPNESLAPSAGCYWPQPMNHTKKEYQLKDCCGRASCTSFITGRCQGPFSRTCSTATEEAIHFTKHTNTEPHDCHSKFGSSPKCWSCDRFLIKSSMFCSSCHKVQPLHEHNAFEVLGMHKDFDIDLKTLEKHYWALQRRVHPDLFHQKTKAEKEYSATASSQLNEAYKTLKYPETRAKYLLQLAGINIDEETKLEDSELLMEVMEIRSMIEEATSQEELKALDRKNKERLANYFTQLRAAFKTHNLEEAKRLVIHLQYFTRIRDELHKRLEL